MSSPASVHFHHLGAPHSLGFGQAYATRHDTGFRDTPADEHRALLAELHAGRPWRDAVHTRFATTNPWLHRIITDPSRTAFLDPVLPTGPGTVLDIGAGWGQVSRPLAAHRPVVALEPVAERLDFIRASARQDGVHDNLAFVAADYLEISFDTRFAAICAIGVLEWAGAFQETADPQQRQRDFLAKTRRELAPNGCLVLGTENRLGLKYLLGCPDDHLGVPHIACLPAPLAAARWHATTRHTLRSFTYSLGELTALLHAAGYAQVDFFAAYPDYKLPAVILPVERDGRPVNDWLSRHAPPPEHNGYDGSALDAAFQETLAAHYRTLAAEGIAHRFAPSFFVRAR